VVLPRTSQSSERE
uniref:Uncharacterized protein n=1 Tax=Jaculus jaculus TaxID=51337 RepID=A0A8C5LK06_JACJA